LLLRPECGISGAAGPSRRQGAGEIAVYGEKPGGSLAGYFVTPAGSEVESLVKAIAHVDP
jgi:hypothetical protein